jgi:hypothetical protein
LMNFSKNMKQDLNMLYVSKSSMVNKVTEI